MMGSNKTYATLLFLSGAAIAACTAVAPVDDGGSSASATSGGTGGDDTVSVGIGVGSGGSCGISCSNDFHAIVDCNGAVVEVCGDKEGCDNETVTCNNACEAAKSNQQSVGCEYYATDMQSSSKNYCFAAIVANTWNTPVKLAVEYQNNNLPIENFARIPSGQGAAVTYGSYDLANGLPPGEVAILFLTGVQGASPNCPVVPATADAQVTGTGVGHSFRITSDVPVVAYQINPYGGGSTAVTGSSLLLPVSVWDTNYIAASAYDVGAQPPSMNIIASEDNTTVTMVPVAAVSGGNGLPSGAQNQPMVFTIHKGQNAQFTQVAPLTGSVISTDKPVGFMAGSPCMNIPNKGVSYCDHGEQMIPPVQALGSEYVGVMHRPRISEPGIWRLIGAVDGTQLSWSSNVGGPVTINRGQSIEFETGIPFVVSAQDDAHPFILFAHMSGAAWPKLTKEGFGDPESVISVPPQQYMSRYVFFTDPTIPETNLVVVRTKNSDNTFSDVTLDCLGVLSGWQAVGDYEWTRTDLSTGDFESVGNCGNGRHEISSEGRFGLWIWGWGTPETSFFTKRVSYGYPGGMNVQPINKVVIAPIPK